MRVKLKKLRDQVIVITGASSGIGLTTARLAAAAGATLVLAARDGDAVRALADEIEARGGRATYVVADVGSFDDVQKIGREAIDRFGRVDTWINNAGVSIYGRLTDVPLEDQKKLFDTNFWGVVHGSLAAVPLLRRSGGALINIGSTVSDRAVPLQGIYSASKHAVKGFTDALRMELEKEHAPISVTLIKPGAIGTPYAEHAKNYLAVEPKLPAPVYAPEIAAKAILHCAEVPERDMFVGSGGKALSLLGAWMPRIADKIMELAFFSQQRTSRPRDRDASDGLHSTAETGMRERGDTVGSLRETSVYTSASLHPVVSGALALGATYMLARLLTGVLSEHERPEEEAAGGWPQEREPGLLPEMRIR